MANRVNAVARHLPQDAKVVAKYTDTKRHCLYFSQRGRLYCYDVLTNTQTEVQFVSHSYERILDTWLSPDGKFIFLAILNGKFSQIHFIDGQEVIRFDSSTRKSISIGKGFSIIPGKENIIIKQGSRCLTPNAPKEKQQWMARDHYYDLYGKVQFAKDEYLLKWH